MNCDFDILLCTYILIKHCLLRVISLVQLLYKISSSVAQLLYEISSSKSTQNFFIIMLSDEFNLKPCILNSITIGLFTIYSMFFSLRIKACFFIDLIML